MEMEVFSRQWSNKTIVWAWKQEAIIRIVYIYIYIYIYIDRRFDAIVSQLWFWPFWFMCLKLWLNFAHIDQRQNMNWPLADNLEATNMTFLPKNLSSNVQSSSIDNSKWPKSKLWHYCIKVTIYSME